MRIAITRNEFDARTLWWRVRGEVLLTTAVWPQDWRRGAIYSVAGQRYKVTHYRHTAASHSYEIWAKPLDARAPRRRTVRQSHADLRLSRDAMA